MRTVLDTDVLVAALRSDLGASRRLLWPLSVSVAVQVKLSFRWRPVLPDPEDDMVLETAVNGGADLLVTFNQRHFKTALERFTPELASPRDALQWLRLL